VIQNASLLHYILFSLLNIIQLTSYFYPSTITHSPPSAQLEAILGKWSCVGESSTSHFN